jgi:hypothetical protein
MGWDTFWAIISQTHLVTLLVAREVGLLFLANRSQYNASRVVTCHDSTYVRPDSNPATWTVAMLKMFCRTFKVLSILACEMKQ